MGLESDAGSVGLSVRAPVQSSCSEWVAVCVCKAFVLAVGLRRCCWGKPALLQPAGMQSASCIWDLSTVSACIMGMQIGGTDLAHTQEDLQNPYL